MPFIQFCKDNIAKVTIGSFGAIIPIVGALFAVDDRYAHAADVQKDKMQTQALVQDTSQTLRRQMIEDKLFELDVKAGQAKNGQLTPIDNALRERYKRQLDELNIEQARTRAVAAKEASK